MEREPWHIYELNNCLLLQKLVLNQENKKILWVEKCAHLLLKLLGYSSDNQANHRGTLTSFSCTYHTGLKKIIGDLISPLVMEGKQIQTLISFSLFSASATHTFSKAPWLMVCVGNMRVASPE